MSSDPHICHVATCLVHLHTWVHRDASITQREIKVMWIFALPFGMLVVWKRYSHLFAFPLLQRVKCHACTFHAEGTHFSPCARFHHIFMFKSRILLFSITLCVSAEVHILFYRIFQVYSLTLLLVSQIFNLSILLYYFGNSGSIF